MKTPFRLAVAGLAVAAGLLLTGCTVVLAGHPKAVNVVVTASRATSAQALAARSLITSGAHPGASTLTSLVRSTSRAASRDLSASTDIASMGYTVTCLTGSGDGTGSGSIDPEYPYLELYLTPGETYRISVDVEPTSTAPGHNTGVTRWGDFADVTIPTDGSAAFVYLAVHPTRGWVLNPAYLSYHYLSETGEYAYQSLFSQNPVQNTADRGFYGPDGKLYYFSKESNGLYLWDDSVAVGTTLKDSAVPDYYGTDDGLTLLAAAADPYLSDTLWLLALGYDQQENVQYGIYYLDTSGTPMAYLWADLTAWVDDPNLGEDLTGLAVDNAWNFYVSANRYSSITTVPAADAMYSGILEFDFGGSWVNQYPGDLVAGYRYFTDVTVQGGRVQALTSPLFNTDLNYYLGGVVAPVTNVGVASILVFDPSLNLVGGYETDYPETTTYTSANYPAADSLWAPVKFLGFGEENRVYLYQQPWTSYSPNGLLNSNSMSYSNSLLDLDAETLTDITMQL